MWKKNVGKKFEDSKKGLIREEKRDVDYRIQGGTFKNIHRLIIDI